MGVLKGAAKAARRGKIRKLLEQNAPKKGMGDAYKIPKGAKKHSPEAAPIRKSIEPTKVSDIYGDPRTQAAIAKAIKEGQKGGRSFSAGGRKITEADRAALKYWGQLEREVSNARRGVKRSGSFSVGKFAATAGAIGGGSAALAFLKQRKK